MKVSKFTGKTLIALILLFILSILIGALILSANNFFRSYNLFDAERTSATVIGKTAEKGLFRPPAHYVKVDVNDTAEGLYEGNLNRVSSRQMKDLEVGDEILGYLISDNHFITFYDIVLDSTLVFIALVVLVAVVIVLIIFGVLTLFPNLRKQGKAKKPTMKKREKQKDVRGRRVSISFLFLIIVFTVSIIFSITALSNGFHKINPFTKTETDAVIIDKDSKRQWLLKSMFINQTDDPIYQFAVSYMDSEHQVVKGVTPNIYGKFDISDSISISYRNSNPLDIFIQDMTWLDVYESMLYWEFFIYAFVLGLGPAIGVVSLRKYLIKK